MSSAKSHDRADGWAFAAAFTAMPLMAAGVVLIGGPRLWQLGVPLLAMGVLLLGWALLQ